MRFENERCGMKGTYISLLVFGLCFTIQQASFQKYKSKPFVIALQLIMYVMGHWFTIINSIALALLYYFSDSYYTCPSFISVFAFRFNKLFI